MTVTSSSLAAGNLVSVENQQFAVTAQVIPQKNVIIGTYDESTYTDITPDVPLRVLSSAEVGSKTGYGFMLHRLARAAEKAGGVETWIIPQAEGGSDPDQAAGELDFSASASVKAGTISLYIAGERINIAVSTDDSADDIGSAVEDAINDDDNQPVTASNAAGVVTITSKSGGTWGNSITLALSLGLFETLPSGVACTITNMSGGSGVGDITGALNALGTGDGQNDKFFTNVIHGYGGDTSTLDALSSYNGAGNDFVGNYKKEVAKPFRSLYGDTTAGSTGLNNLIAVADLRTTDRTNGVVAAPGEYYHPQEIAAFLLGLMAVINSNRAQEGYIDQEYGTSYAAVADRWTNEYDNRDLAVKSGISTTFVKNGTLTFQNIITFYRPDSIAPESNGYRPMRNISIIQNILYNFKANFEREKWKGIAIVEDISAVTDVTSKQKARDIGTVLDDLIALADIFAGFGWLYTASYTKSQLQEGDKVTLRAGLTGFDIIFPIILSGEGGIFNSLITFDTSIAVLALAA